LEAARSDLGTLAARCLRVSALLRLQQNTILSIAILSALQIHMGLLDTGARSFLRLHSFTHCCVLERVCWLLQILLFLLTDNLQGVWKLAIRKNIETAAHLLFSVLVRDATESHVVETLHLSETLLSGCDLNLLTSFIALLFVLFSNVLFIQALLIFHNHVDWVVHQAVATLAENMTKLTFELRWAAFCSSPGREPWPQQLASRRKPVP
jgi:hypothetical protein